MGEHTKENTETNSIDDSGSRGRKRIRGPSFKLGLLLNQFLNCSGKTFSYAT